MASCFPAAILRPVQVKGSSLRGPSMAHRTLLPTRLFRHHPAPTQRTRSAAYHPIHPAPLLPGSAWRRCPYNAPYHRSHNRNDSTHGTRSRFFRLLRMCRRSQFPGCRYPHSASGPVRQQPHRTAPRPASITQIVRNGDLEISERTYLRSDRIPRFLILQIRIPPLLRPAMLRDWLPHLPVYRTQARIVPRQRDGPHKRSNQGSMQ